MFRTLALQSYLHDLLAHKIQKLTKRHAASMLAFLYLLHELAMNAINAASSSLFTLFLMSAIWVKVWLDARSSLRWAPITVECIANSDLDELDDPELKVILLKDCKENRSIMETSRVRESQIFYAVNKPYPYIQHF